MCADHIQFPKGWPFCVQSHRKEMICDARTYTFDIVKVFLDFSTFKIIQPQSGQKLVFFCINERILMKSLEYSLFLTKK